MHCDRREVTQRLEVALTDFVPPAPKPKPRTDNSNEPSTDSQRRTSLKSGQKSKKYGEYGPPTSGWAESDEIVQSYRVVPEDGLQLYAKAGTRNQKMGRLCSGETVTEFAATQGWGCWIRINCGLHPPEWVARIEFKKGFDRTWDTPEPGQTKAVLVSLNKDAVPKDLLCSHPGCTARSRPSLGQARRRQAGWGFQMKQRSCGSLGRVPLGS